MENNIQNEVLIKKSAWDNKFFRTIIVILIIALMVALGYFVYEKYIKVAENNNDDNKTVETILSKEEVGHIASIKDYEVYLDKILYKGIHSFDEQKTIDFSNINSDQYKAAMVLELLEYVDKNPDVYCTVVNNDEFCTLSKSIFDYKTKLVFGEDVVINLANLKEPIETGICARWSYNETKQIFERGSDDCGIGSGNYLYDEYYATNYQLKKVTDGYEATSRVVYVSSDADITGLDEEYSCDLLASKDSEKITEIAECSYENVAKYVNDNQSKFYTRKYTYTVDGDNIYISKYELIK